MLFPEASTHGKVEDFYTVGDELGKGGFAVVRKATNKSTGEVRVLSIQYL